MANNLELFFIIHYLVLTKKSCSFSLSSFFLKSHMWNDIIASFAFLALFNKNKHHSILITVLLDEF